MENINYLLDQLLEIPLTVGFIFIVAGVLLLLFPPKKINGLYGYRTRNSMASQERWDFAQRYSSIAMILTGIALWVGSALTLFISVSIRQQQILSFVFLGVATIVLIVLTEMAIKKHFPKSE